MNSKMSFVESSTFDNRLTASSQLFNEYYMVPRNLRNWKSVSNIHSRKKFICRTEMKSYLQKYFNNHMSIIQEKCKSNQNDVNHYIDKKTFEEILRSSDIIITNASLESLWNSCQPSENGITYEVFLQNFVSCQPNTNQNASTCTDASFMSSNQCQILNYVIVIKDLVKKYWIHLKSEFFHFDRFGRLYIGIDQAMYLMKKYCFPLNEKQRLELAMLFSRKSSGQFYYFNFMQQFSNQSALKNMNRNTYSRSTYFIQSKQSWTCLPISINCIFNRIRSQSIRCYGNIYQAFKPHDQYNYGYLTQNQLEKLLEQFDINLDEDELYHIFSEMDKNQDGLISYEEYYYALIPNSLVI